jgi:hypothetical protein
MQYATKPLPPREKEGGTSPETWSRRERDDDYFAVIEELSEKHRVIVDEDGLQFILQKRHSEGAHGAVWRAIGYAASATGLVSLCARSLQQLGANHRLALAALTERPRDYLHLASAKK